MQRRWAVSSRVGRLGRGRDRLWRRRHHGLVPEAPDRAAGFTREADPRSRPPSGELPDIVDGRTALLLLGIVVAGLAAEYAVRLLLSRARPRGFDRLVGHSPLRAFGRAVLLDIVALVALAIAGRLVLARSAMPRACRASSGSRFSRRWSTGAPSTSCSAPGCGRARRRAASPPSTMPTARGLLIGAELGGRPAADRRPSRPRAHEHRRQPRTRQRRRHPLRAADRGLPAWVVWHWRNEMAAWLSAMVSERKIGRQLKLDTARRWWMFGLAFYALMGAGGDLCRADRKRHRGARPEDDRIVADRAAAVRDADAPDHAPHRVGAADGGRRGGRLPAPDRPALRHDPDRRRLDGAGAGRDDAGGMAAARPRRQARGAHAWWRSTPSGGS